MVSSWKLELEGQFQGQKWGVFSTVLPIRAGFYFMNRNYFIMASSIKKYPHIRWEVRQIMKIAVFSVKPLITLTCRNSLINPMTNEFYFGISISLQMKQAAGKCDRSMTIKFIRGERP